ncbi:unnamed protein product [Debaryomyces tyrocola]|nr:unnamed protein product [Debaryomyces tyrocola]
MIAVVFVIMSTLVLDVQIYWHIFTGSSKRDMFPGPVIYAAASYTSCKGNSR